MNVITLRKGILIGRLPAGTEVRLAGVRRVLPATAPYLLRAEARGREVHGFGPANHQETIWRS